MTPAEIESLLSKITPEPWQVEYGSVVDSVPSSGYNFTNRIAYLMPYENAVNNGPFIAAAPQIVRQLLREREEAEARIKEKDFRNAVLAFQQGLLNVRTAFATARLSKVNMSAKTRFWIDVYGYLYCEWLWLQRLRVFIRAWFEWRKNFWNEIRAENRRIIQGER